MSARVPGFSYDGRRKVARFVLYVPGSLGKARRKKTVYGVKRHEALAGYARFRDEVCGTAPRANGRAIAEHEPSTFGEFIKRHWEKIAARVSESTAKNYRCVVTNHLLPEFGSTRLDRITSAMVQDFAAELKKRGYAAASINDYLNTFRVLLNQAVEREEIKAYPLKRRIRLEKSEKPTLELRSDEKDRFLAAFDDETGFRRFLAGHRSVGKLVVSPHFGGKSRRFGGGIRPDGAAAGVYFDRIRAMKPLFVVALETGLRRSDLLTLYWSSIDFENGWIRVVTKKTRREVTVPFSDACRQALLDCRNRPIVCARVFVDERGKAVSWTRVRRYFSLAKELAGITRRFRFHDLRHTFGSTLASRGVSLQVIAKALGHASVRMSERYARPSEESLLEIRRALNFNPIVGSSG